ncbi:MAG: hypothetical protein WC278_04285 [Bacilli bacterium]
MENQKDKNKKMIKYTQQEIFYIVMSIVIAILIVLLFYIAISHIIHAVNWTVVESIVTRGFYVIVSIFSFVTIGLFSFAEYLMIKVLLNRSNN